MLVSFNRAGWSGGFLSSKMPLDWLKNMFKFSTKNYITTFESTTGKVIQKSNSPLTNCRNLMVKDGPSSGHSSHIVKVGVSAICKHLKPWYTLKDTPEPAGSFGTTPQVP